MRRETSSEHIENLIARIRAGIPGIAIRTTFIVGFPGRDRGGDLNTARLHRAHALRAPRRLQVLAGGRLARAKMEGQTPGKVKHAATTVRWNSSRRSPAKSASPSRRAPSARLSINPKSLAASRRPDIDGRILLTRPAPVGEFIDVKITGRRSTT
jgi:ribosomal protein S12 methylthiotransferase